MGLFDILFGTSKPSATAAGGRSIRTSKELRERLYGISSLNQTQREKVFGLMQPHLLDDGRLSHDELSRTIQRSLYHLTESGELSHEDYNQVKRSLLQ